MNSEQFNQNMQNNYYNKAGKAMAVSKNIDSLVLKIASQSSASMTSSNLGQMICEFLPLLEDVKAVESSLKDSDTFIIYQKYHTFIKQLEGQNGEIIAMSQQSLNCLSNPEKMKVIQQRVVKLMTQLKQLHTEAFQLKQRYLLWMDRKECNNYSQLKELQDLYQGQVLVQYYTDDNLFRKKVLELKDYPLIIIMSANAAGSNEKYNDGKHFQFLKDNQQNLRLRGVLIYCGEQGVKNCSPLLKDPSRLLAGITTDPSELMNMAKSLIVSQAFKRIISLEQLNFFLPNLKANLMAISQRDWSGVSLFEFSPKNINYKSIFKEAKSIIQEDQIEFDSEVVDNMLGIPEQIEKIFDRATDENKITKDIANLYSKQSPTFPVYQCLNSTLNMMNERLITKLTPFINLFTVSFYKYKDENVTAITKDGKSTKLFRGSTISKDIFDDMVKLNSFVTLPSFSSFSTNRDKAIGFIGFNTKYGECDPVLLEYDFKTGSQGFANRPKCIAESSDYPKEDEYIVYPFTMFKIDKIVPPKENDEKQSFTQITLTIS